MKEYKVVYSPEGRPFDDIVSECLNDGWKLYGNPWSHQEPEGSVVHLYQAIERDITYVLVEEDEDEQESAIETNSDESSLESKDS